MKSIILTQNKVALVDDQDFEALSKHKWSYQRSVWGSGYAFRNKDRSNLPMHRQILGLEKRDGKQVDHINGNGLDNRRENLRLATAAENARNSKIRKDNTTGYKGVYLSKRRLKKPYYSHIMVKRKSIHLGMFATAKEAALAYNKKAKELFGDFARLNIL